MQAWWESLSDLLRVLYCIAIPSTLILVLQMLLTMVGGHGDGGVDVSDTSGLDGGLDGGLDFSSDVGMDGVDFDLTPDIDVGDVNVHHGTDSIDGGNPADYGTLKLLSLQTIITFLTVFSWISIVCVRSELSALPSTLIGAASGLAMMFVVAKMVQMSARLAENGTLNLNYAIGETASVYLTIPPKGEGTGKVNLKVQGRFGEFDAVNAEGTPLPTGSQVLVTDVVGETLVVEPISAKEG